MTFLFEILSRLTCKNIEETLYKIIIQIQIRFKTLIWRREFQTKSGVSSGFTKVNEQVGVLSEIDEKPELPHNVIVPNFHRVFLNSQNNISIC